MSHAMSRRWFLSRVGELLLWGLVARWLPLPRDETAPVAGGPPGRLAVIHHPHASDGSGGRDDAHLRADVVADMVGEAVRAFTGADTVADAWRQIIPDPNRRVAIKVNCQIQGVFTKAKVVRPVLDGLVARGVRPDHILVYDMHDTAFEVAGFGANLGPGVKVGTVEQFGGYGRFLFDRLANLLTGGYPNAGWNYLAATAKRSPSPVARRAAAMLLPTPEPPFDCEYLINVPVLKALDGYSGVSLSMKNHYGSIGNPAEHHDDIMDHLVRINGMPEIRRKTRLILLDAIFGEYQWVNGRDQSFVDRVNAVVAGTDPVAIDHWGWQRIEKLRSGHGMAPVTPEPRFLDKAVAAGLGVRQPADVVVRSLGG